MGRGAVNRSGSRAPPGTQPENEPDPATVRSLRSTACSNMLKRRGSSSVGTPSASRVRIAAPQGVTPQGASTHDAASEPLATVRVLEKAQVATAAQHFLDSLAPDWKKRDSLPVDAAPDLEDWDWKLDDTEWVAKKILHGVNKAELAIGCFFDKQPLGLMTLKEPAVESGYTPQRGALRVEWMVTHPGATGAGSGLLELAVKLSQECGHEGRLTLVSTAEATAAYKALGFIGTTNKLTLDPSRSDMWVEQRGRWQLKKYLTKPLADGMEEVKARVRK